MALHSVPVEILFLILQSIHCPRDLNALIRASPSCYRAYVQSPMLVLPAIIRNAIQPDALYHALAVFHCPERSALTSELQQAYLDKYFRRANTDSFAFPTDEAGVAALWRFHSQVSYFVDDYARRATTRIHFAGPEDVPVPAVLPPLSSTERTRFFRAFYRHELYSRIFPPIDQRRSAVSPSIASAGVQLTRFLTRIEPWEVEEMNCVHHYFMNLIVGFLDDLQDQIVNAVLTAPGVHLPPSLSSPMLAPSSLHSSDGVCDDNYDVHSLSAGDAEGEDDEQRRKAYAQMIRFDTSLDKLCLWMFSEDGLSRSHAYLNYLASLGMIFMRRLVSSDSPQRKAIIVEDPLRRREFLPQALANAPDNALEVQAPAKINVSDPTHPNSGYSLFNIDYGGYLRFNLLSDYTFDPLRGMAYVFWDSERIADPATTDRLRWAAGVAAGEERGCRSAEVRLEGVTLPWGQMKRISEEFGPAPLRWRRLRNNASSS